MLFRGLGILIALLVCVVPACAQAPGCEAVLAGLITHDTTFEDTSLQTKYINWLKSNELNHLKASKTVASRAE